LSPTHDIDLGRLVPDTIHQLKQELSLLKEEKAEQERKKGALFSSKSMLKQRYESYRSR
jgi:hypothetical protein